MSSCAKPEPLFASGGLGLGFDWLEVPATEGTIPGLFFLMGGRRLFLNGGRVTGCDSSLTTSDCTAEAATLVEDSASGVAVTSASPSGSSADNVSSLGRFDPPGWLRSRALVDCCSLCSSCIEVSSPFSTFPFTFDAAFRFGLVSERGGDGS